MTRPDKTPWLWTLGMLALAALPVATLVLIRRAPRGATESAGARVFKHSIQCAGVSPASFTIEPSGKQELTARFAGDSGAYTFRWFTSGGKVSSLSGKSGDFGLAGYVYLDDFDDATTDNALWRLVVPKGTTVENAGGSLHVRAFESGGQDVAAQVHGTFEVVGDFAAEITIRQFEVMGNRGGTPLTFVTTDGYEAHIQALGGTGFTAVEANTGNPNGTWGDSASVLFGAGPLRIQIARVDSTISFRYDLGSGYMNLGASRPGSAAPGRISLETWSLESHPSVEATIDNFGVAQNSVIVWQAPGDAAPGSTYSIRLAPGCEATAVIRKSGAPG